MNQNIEDLNIHTADIDVAYRVGKRHGTQSRQILVKFVTKLNRERVIRNRKSFRGQRVFINEDLTKINQVLLTTIKQSTPEDETAWSWGGKIFHKTGSGRINTITFKDYSYWLGDDLQQLMFGGAHLPS